MGISLPRGMCVPRFARFAQNANAKQSAPTRGRSSQTRRVQMHSKQLQVQTQHEQNTQADMRL